jgi:hypothetical protein
LLLLLHHIYSDGMLPDPIQLEIFNEDPSTQDPGVPASNAHEDTPPIELRTRSPTDDDPDSKRNIIEIKSKERADRLREMSRALSSKQSLPGTNQENEKE